MDEENKQIKHKQRYRMQRSKITPPVVEANTLLALNTSRANRLQKDLESFFATPPTGISCFPVNDVRDHLLAEIIGPEDTPYEGGLFKLEIKIPKRYPFEPPSVRFMTPIYHPNIDKSGRICLDTLKMPPQGTWSPCLNLSTVLMTVRLLMSSPGPKDPLMTEIWQEYTYNYVTFAEKARKHTKQYATENQVFAMDKDLMTQSEAGQDAAANISPYSSASAPDSDTSKTQVPGLTADFHAGVAKMCKSKKFNIYTPPECPEVNAQVKMVKVDQHHSPSLSLLDVANTKESVTPPAAQIVCYPTPPAAHEQDTKEHLAIYEKPQAIERSDPSPPAAEVVCCLSPPAAKTTCNQKDTIEENSAIYEKSEAIERSPLPSVPAAGRAIGVMATNMDMLSHVSNICGNLQTRESCEVEASEQKQDKRKPGSVSEHDEVQSNKKGRLELE